VDVSGEPGPDLQRRRERARDALAITAAYAAGDEQAMEALQAAGIADGDIAWGMFELLMEALFELGEDPAAWAARKQEESIAAEAGNPS
jgi:hypothetical protein